MNHAARAASSRFMGPDPKEQRTKSMTFVGYLTMAALISLLILIFIGMGLQRFAEL
ncbi:MAG: hypothetical protein IE922_13400 [Sphingomonadales bacterium]|nr:hypothetical protein [Sphingomonadales bacterium]